MLGFVDQYGIKMSMIFFLHKTQSQCTILNCFHLTLGREHTFSTLPSLHPSENGDVMKCSGGDH